MIQLCEEEDILVWIEVKQIINFKALYAASMCFLGTKHQFSSTFKMMKTTIFVHSEIKKQKLISFEFSQPINFLKFHDGDPRSEWRNTNYLLEIGKVIMQVPILITNMLGAPPKASNIKTQIGGERRRWCDTWDEWKNRADKQMLEWICHSWIF